MEMLKRFSRPSNGAVQDGSDTEHDYLGNNEGDIDSGRGEAGKSPETAVSQGNNREFSID